MPNTKLEKEPERRRFSLINTTLTITFTISLIGMVFWVSSLDARVATIQTLQELLLEANAKQDKCYTNLTKEMQDVKKHLGVIYNAIMSIND